MRADPNWTIVNKYLQIHAHPVCEVSTTKKSHVLNRMYNRITNTWGNMSDNSLSHIIWESLELPINNPYICIIESKATMQAMNVNNTTSLQTQVSSTYIDGLCDVVPNLKRTEADFMTLLNCLKNIPKECTPFKGKILQHLQVHALGNPNANIKLLSACFARAAILFRKTPNKSEGALGAWKSSLLNELRDLEDSITELYKIVGLTSNSIIDKDKTSGDDAILKSVDKLSETRQDFETIINEYLLKVNLAANNICALISLPTDFNLPIPVLVLLRMAAKVGALRWKDYKKKPDGLLRNHVYSLSPYLIDIQLMMFHQIVMVLGTDMIPFTSFVNQTLCRILEWTRASNLLKHDESLYHSLRSRVFKMISFLIEQLSLNINLEPRLLQSLLEVELVENLDELATQQPNKLKDKHVVDALKCFEDLLIIYNDLLDAPLEKKVKSYVIQTCMKIYRDFSSNMMSLNCREQLLQLLQIIANQPYAASTTEIAHNIFQLAYRIESESGIKSLAYKLLKVGLAHRPVIVTQHDVYSRYGDSVLMSSELPLTGVEQLPPVVIESNLNDAEPINAVALPNGTDVERSDLQSDADQAQAVEVELPFVDASQNPPSNFEEPILAEDKSTAGDTEPTPAPSKLDEDESDISKYMDHFVEKPCIWDTDQLWVCCAR